MNVAVISLTNEEYHGVTRRRGESQAKASGGRKRYARSYKTPLISRDRGVTRACEIIIYTPRNGITSLACLTHEATEPVCLM